MYRNKAIYFAIITSFVVIILGYAYLNSSLPHYADHDFWYGEPDASDSYVNTGWWLTNKTGGLYGGSRAAADTIQYILQNNRSELLKSVFSQMFIDMHSDSIWIVLTRVDNETKGKVLELVHPDPPVTVHFMKGPAPCYQLEEWLRIVCDHWDEWRSNGLVAVSAGISENGTILIELTEVGPREVGVIKYTLENEVPLSILVIRKGSLPVLA